MQISKSFTHISSFHSRTTLRPSDAETVLSLRRFSINNWVSRVFEGLPYRNRNSECDTWYSSDGSLKFLAVLYIWLVSTASTFTQFFMWQVIVNWIFTSRSLKSSKFGNLIVSWECTKTQLFYSFLPSFWQNFFEFKTIRFETLHIRLLFYHYN